LRIRQPADEAIFISLNTNRLLRHKKHSLPAACLPPACRLPAACLPPACRLPAACLLPACRLPAACLPAKAGQRQGKGRAKAGQRQGKGRLAMTYTYILTLGMLADNHKKN